MSYEQDSLKSTKKLQDIFKNAQSEMANLHVTGVSGAGMVSVTMNGRYQVIQVSIEEEAWREGKTFIEALTAAAMNDATIKIQEATQNKISRFATILGTLSAFSDEAVVTEEDKK